METLFVLLTFTLYMGCVFGLRRVYHIAHWKTAAALGIWLALQMVLAQMGYFQEWRAIPPHFALVLVPNLILILYASFARVLSKPLSRFSGVPLVGIQTFRIAMECILYALVQRGLIPKLMTFTGSNFDLLVGLTAPFMALLLYWKPSRTITKLGIGWNVAGFAILVNTAVHGVLATPTPFQVYFTTPSNALLAEWPWIWLPGFVVPFALVTHVLSVRQLMKKFPEAR